VRALSAAGEHSISQSPRALIGPVNEGLAQVTWPAASNLGASTPTISHPPSHTRETRHTSLPDLRVSALWTVSCDVSYPAFSPARPAKHLSAPVIGHLQGPSSIAIPRRYISNSPIRLQKLHITPDLDAFDSSTLISVPRLAIGPLRPLHSHLVRCHQGPTLSIRSTYLSSLTKCSVAFCSV
jgi:hypothetical protein